MHLPDGSGDAIVNAVATDRPGVKFLALSVSDAAEDVIAVIRAGARGYVTKTISGPELAAAIERVATGDAVFSPRLAGFVLDAFRAGEQVGGDAELDELTPREREVLQLIARGYMYKEIAARLHLSVKTVESHVSNVLRKLQLSTRHELARWATQHRLVVEQVSDLKSDTVGRQQPGEAVWQTVLSGGVEQPLVVGDERVDVLAQREGGCEVNRIEGAQRRRLELGRPGEELGAEEDDVALGERR